MKYKITQGEGYSLASITEKKSDIAFALLSVDIHNERTVSDQALQLLYPDALMSGAGKYDRAEFLHAVNLLGASINISTAGGILTISVKSTAATFSKVLKLVFTILSSPTFPKKEIERIKTTNVNELQEAREDSRSISQDELSNRLYKEKDRRYSYSFDETEEAIKKCTEKQLRKLHELVTNSPWTCSVAGDTKTVEHFAKTIKSLKKGSVVTLKKAAYHSQKVPKKSLILTDVPGRQNIDFSIGAPVPITLHHPDYTPLVFGLAVLGKWGGFTGRLMSTVRELEGLTYGIYARAESFTASEQGNWRIITFFAPEKSLQGLTSTFREIAKIHEDGITEAELQKFKSILHTGQVLLKDSVPGMLADLHAYHQQGFSLAEMAEHKSKIKTLTLSEVNTALKKYLDPKVIVVSGAGPVKKVKKELGEFIKKI